MPYVPKAEYRRLLSGLPRKPPFDGEREQIAIVETFLREKEIELARAEGYMDGLKFAMEAMRADEDQSPPVTGDSSR